MSSIRSGLVKLVQLLTDWTCHSTCIFTIKPELNQFRIVTCAYKIKNRILTVFYFKKKNCSLE